ncbi:MAG TPA: hypothetical protein QF753_10525 [Victivallales bacterium]|nr:hypothetical protein [Victivallales bacterium]
MKKIAIIVISIFISIGAFASSNKSMINAPIQSDYEGILQLDAHLNEHVNKGQLLFHIKTSLLKLAALKAKNDMKYAKEIYLRDKKLSGPHIISKKALEITKNTYIDDYIDYQTALINIKNCYYYAPFAGTVTKIDNYSGSCVGDASEVMVVTKT